MSKLEVSGHEDQVSRSSLGRIAKIGELYDVRRECMSSLSLFDKSFPENLIKHTDVNHTEFDYKFTENISDRFDLFKIEPELQMSTLLGLIKLKGSGSFLKCETESEKTISCSLVCRTLTVSEKLFASFDEILQHVDLKILQDSQYTHLITEINWGANCLLNLEFTCGSETKEKDIRGALSAEFQKIKCVTISGGGHLEKKTSSILSGENINIKVFADILPKKQWPTTVEGFCEFVAEVPSLLANVNNGKGKPLNYVMISLQNIRKLANLEIDTDILVRKIDESFLLSTILFFEEIAQMKRKLNDLNVLFSEYKNYILEKDLTIAGKMKEELSIKESELKLLISGDWVLVRSGEKTLKDLINQIEEFKTNNLNMLIYKEYLDSCSAILKKLTMLKNYTSLGIIFLGKGETFHSLQTTYPSHEFIVLVTSKAIELADPQLSKDTHVYFVTLANEKKSNTKYVVLDLDITGEEEFMGTKIMVAKCFHLKGLRVISRDVLATYLAESVTNFVRPIPGTKVEHCNLKPRNRVPLEIPCPGVETETCPNVTQTWFCHVCKMNVEYGFDDNYYCTCGKKPITAFEYRCVHFAHGDVFVRPSEDFLKDILKTLKPLNDMVTATKRILSLTKPLAEISFTIQTNIATMESKKKDMEEEQKEKGTIEKFLKELETKVEKYKSEQEQIINASVKFEMFLKINAITLNGSVVKCMQHLMYEEEKKPHKSDIDEQILENLRKILNLHHAKMVLLREVFEQSGGTIGNVTIDDVYNLEGNLYKLELMGPFIKKLVEEFVRSNRAFSPFMLF